MSKIKYLIGSAFFLSVTLLSLTSRAVVADEHGHAGGGHGEGGWHGNGGGNQWHGGNDWHGGNNNRWDGEYRRNNYHYYPYNSYYYNGGYTPSYSGYDNYRPYDNYNNYNNPYNNYNTPSYDGGYENGVSVGFSIGG